MRRSPAHGAPSDVAAAGDARGVANGVDGTVAVFDTASGDFEGRRPARRVRLVRARERRVGRTLGVGGGAPGRPGRPPHPDLSATGSLPVDPTTRTRIDVFAEGVAVGEGSVWVSGDVLNRGCGGSTRSPGGEPGDRAAGGPVAVAVGEGAVWVANQLDDSVTRVDARTGRVGPTIAVGREPVALAAAKGLVWVANRLDATVSRIDPGPSRRRHRRDRGCGRGRRGRRGGRVGRDGGLMSAARRTGRAVGLSG